jgi:hypothetical protein
MIQKIILCFLCLWGVCEAKQKVEIPKDAVIKTVGYYEFHHGGAIHLEEIGNDDVIYFYRVGMRDLPPNVYVKLRIQEEEERDLYSLKADREGRIEAVFYSKTRRRTRREVEFTFKWGEINHSFIVSVFPKDWDYSDPGERPPTKKLNLVNYCWPLPSGRVVYGS